MILVEQCLIKARKQIRRVMDFHGFTPVTFSNQSDHGAPQSKVVVCGKEQFDDTHLDTLLNPTLIVKILSESTEAYGRGRKFEHYRKLDSLAEYVLIAQNRPHIESYRRQADQQWLLTECSELDGALRLPSIDRDLILAEVHDKVELQDA